MIFGPTPLDQAVGALLAHSVKLDRGSFKKGRRLSAEDVEQLRAAGLESVIAARLEAGDCHEDDAAASLAQAVMGENLEASAAFTGRCNLIAKARGVLLVERARLDAINGIDESVTLARSKSSPSPSRNRPWSAAWKRRAAQPPWSVWRPCGPGRSAWCRRAYRA
jgi:molybdenum cofactor cytidylyltransferase